MHDTRIHTLYVVVIFFMLGIGMLIGEGLYPGQIRQQAKTLASLRVQVDAVLQQNKTSKDQLDKMQSAFDAIRPGMVRGKLNGKRVIVLQTGDSHDAVESAISALNDAGATVITVTLGDGITNVTNEQREDIESISNPSSPRITTESTDGTGQSPNTDNSPAFDALAAILTEGTAKNAVNEQELEKLETLGMVNVDGSLDEGSNLIVVVGGQADAPSDMGDADPATVLDIPLIQRLGAVSHNRSTLVGCESSTAGTSYITDYQNAGIATVDCIDLPIGQLALPFALRGGVDKGDYGIKGTAKRILPASISGNGTT